MSASAASLAAQHELRSSAASPAPAAPGGLPLPSLAGELKNYPLTLRKQLFHACFDDGALRVLGGPHAPPTGPRYCCFEDFDLERCRLLYGRHAVLRVHVCGAAKPAGVLPEVRVHLCADAAASPLEVCLLVTLSCPSLDGHLLFSGEREAQAAPAEWSVLGAQLLACAALLLARDKASVEAGRDANGAVVRALDPEWFCTRRAPLSRTPAPGGNFVVDVTYVLP